MHREIQSRRPHIGRTSLLLLIAAAALNPGCPGTGGGDGNDNTTPNRNDNANTNANTNTNTNTNVNGNTNTNRNGNDNAAANRAPEADAGSDRRVVHGATVTLNGSGSSDPDDDDLSFQWRQTDGPDVSLTGGATASPRFVAPNEDATLTFELTVNDGQESDSDDVTVTVVPRTEPTLFLVAGLERSGAVMRYADIANADDDTEPDTIISGSATQLMEPTDVVVNSAGEIIVANIFSESIVVFAPDAEGNEAPIRVVIGENTRLDNRDPQSMAINVDEDLLFLSDKHEEVILVFEGTTQSSFDGDVAPARVIESSSISNPLGISLAANDDLYVANQNEDNVLVFENASTLDGSVSPSRVITNVQFESLYDVYVDSGDTLYVLDEFDGEIYIFNNASTLDGAASPDGVLNVIPAGENALRAIAVDLNGIGYITDRRTNALYIYENIATLTGSLDPDVTIQPASPEEFPVRVFLSE